MLLVSVGDAPIASEWLSAPYIKDLTVLFYIDGAGQVDQYIWFILTLALEIYKRYQNAIASQRYTFHKNLFHCWYMLPADVPGLLVPIWLS